MLFFPVEMMIQVHERLFTGEEAVRRHARGFRDAKMEIPVDDEPKSQRQKNESSGSDIKSVPAKKPRPSFVLVAMLLLSASAFCQQSRHFIFHYSFSVRNVPPGQKLEVWFPQAHSDPFQEVTIVQATGDLPLTGCGKSHWKVNYVVRSGSSN